MAGAACSADRIETVDARTVEGDVVAIDGKAVSVRVGDKTESLALAGVSEIVFAAADALMDHADQGLIISPEGDRLGYKDLTMAASRFRFTNDLLGLVTAPMSAVAVVLWPDAGLTPRQVERKYRQLKLPGGTDILLLEGDKGALMMLPGVLQGFAGDKILFKWKDKIRQVDLDLVRVIHLATVGGERPKPGGAIVGRKGSTVRFSSLAMEGRQITAVLIGLGKMKIDRDKVAAIRLRSSNMVNLADLKPSEVVERGFFDLKFPHRRNASVGGGPISLGGKEYRSGLGLHSFCELTYDLDQPFSQFVAVAGIDDAVRPNGNAVLTFLGDGKVLGEPIPLTGKDKQPTPVRLKITGVKKFAIRVDFGPDGLAVGDHVDLAAARLVK